MKYVSVEQMIAVEKAADRAGHSYQEMMEAAGKGLAEVIHGRYWTDGENRVLALVGSGNNGGDALVALHYLLQRGWSARAVLLRKRAKDDHLLSRVEKGGGVIKEATRSQDYRELIADELLNTTVVVDGVLGTGIKLPLRSPLDDLLQITNQLLESNETSPAVVAVDCPSGIDCDTGAAAEVCLPADLTVTMAAVKQGMLKFPAYNYLGDLELVDIGLPSGLPEWERITREVIQAQWVAANLPDRPRNAHKGTFGTALIMAGSQPYPGAAVLAGKSAYRIGAGLVTMAVPRSIYSGLLKSFPEATWVVLEEGSDGISQESAADIEAALSRPTACLLGPGWGTGRDTGNFLKAVLNIDQLPPLVIDADGLRLLAELSEWEEVLPAMSVLTPHPGEMAVLTGLSVTAIQSDRVEIAEKFARKWDQIVLLKGAHTVIAEPGGQTRILIGANPALARAGSGDVLAGMITGLIAQGMEPFAGAAAGAWLHNYAGALAAEKAASSAAVLAGDISREIGPSLAAINRG